LAVALAFIAALIGIGIGAAATAWRSPMLPFFEACCVFPVGAFVVLELWPAVNRSLELPWYGGATTDDSALPTPP
jgi:hypothetical protein